MIYITGDTHGPNAIGYRSVDGIVPRLSKESFPQQGSLTRDDYLIICGDFGMIFDYDSRYDPARSMFRDVILLDHGESKEEKYWRANRSRFCSVTATMRILTDWIRHIRRSISTEEGHIRSGKMSAI